MKRGKAAWIRIAQARILNILAQRVAANIRQLEVTISEAGPDDLRPDPINLSEGLQSLIRAGKVVQIKRGKEEDSVFYALATTDRTIVDQRVHELLVLVRIHRSLAQQNDYSGDVLVTVIHESFLSVPECTFLGRLPKSAPLDGVYNLHGFQVGEEARNGRKWVYPWSDRIWIMVRKCLEIDALPFLVRERCRGLRSFGSSLDLGSSGSNLAVTISADGTSATIRGAVPFKEYEDRPGGSP
jgi:hypothetical protein